MEKNELLNLIDMEVVPFDESSVSEELATIPFEKLASLGIATKLVEPFTRMLTKNKGVGTGLYKVDIPKGTHLASFKDGKGNLGTVLDNKTNKIAGQATIQSIPIDPMSLAMMGMLANMERKLADIQELQKEMMQFLEQKEKSEQRGNLIFLQDIYENFKFNVGNETYIQNNHVKVLDIKQTSEQKIDFYKSQIKTKLEKGNLVHLDSDVNSWEKKLKNDLAEYQLALYTYAFSSMMDIVFLENFGQDFLDSIKNKIEAYKFEYQSVYTEVFNYIEKKSDTSLQQMALDVTSKSSKGLGRLLKDTFVAKKTGIDKTLTKAGEDINDYKVKRTDSKTFKLIENKESKVEPFVVNIEMMNSIYNKPVEVLFDNKGIYINQN